MVKAVWNGTTIADSFDTVVVEGNHYFPLEAVDPTLIEESAHSSVCPWKGTARYYTVKTAAGTNPNAAWYYADPKPAAAAIKGRVAFWKGVVVS